MINLITISKKTKIIIIFIGVAIFSFLFLSIIFSNRADSRGDFTNIKSDYEYNNIKSQKPTSSDPVLESVINSNQAMNEYYNSKKFVDMIKNLVILTVIGSVLLTIVNATLKARKYM